MPELCLSFGSHPNSCNNARTCTNACAHKIPHNFALKLVSLHLDYHADVLPPFMREIYANLAIATMDFEFGQPGCNGTWNNSRAIGKCCCIYTSMFAGIDSDFVSLFKFNALLLLLCALPVLVVEPIMMFYHGAVRQGKVVLPCFAMLPKGKHAERWYHRWKDRLIFGITTWIIFGTFIMAGRAVSALYCQQDDSGTSACT